MFNSLFIVFLPTPHHSHENYTGALGTLQVLSTLISKAPTVPGSCVMPGNQLTAGRAQSLSHFGAESFCGFSF